MDRIQNVGSARVLSGLIYPLHIFVTDGEAWATKDKIAVISKTQSVQNWLCRQAAECNVPVSFHRGGCFGWDSDISVDYIPHGNGTSQEYTDWVIYLLDRIGWTDPVKLYNLIVSETACHNVHVLLHANTWGRSYSIPFARGGDVARHFVEACFIYRYDTDGEESTAAAIAHELLHVYGAWDLYETYAVSSEQARAAGEWFPNDIMRRDSWYLDELVVGPLTAWRIGWGEKREEWYEWFRPKQRRSRRRRVLTRARSVVGQRPISFGG